MNRSRTALAILLGVVVAVAGISVVSFAAANRSDSDTQKAEDIALSASISKDRPHSSMANGVTNVKASKIEANKITLTWDAVSDASGYYVYSRDIDQIGEYALAAKVEKPTASIAKLTATTRYQFRVTAYTQKDGIITECPASELEVITKTGEVPAIEPERSSDVLKFSWTKVDKASGYDIHRSCKANGNKFQFYKSVNSTTTEFEDKDVKEGELYTYRIIPFRTVNNVKYYSETGKTIDLLSGLSAPADFMALSNSSRVTLYWKSKKLASGYNIYMAKVKKLMPGLNACFVDVGYERDAFLHYLDLGNQFNSYEKYLKQVQSDRKKLFPFSKATRQPDLKKDGSVQTTLKVGQEVLVQIVKEPISTKGPRLTGELSFAGRYLVLIPFNDKVSVSSKIKSGEERARLKQLIHSIKPKNCGVIVRTVAEGKRVAELDAELKVLNRRWEDAIQKVQKTQQRPQLVFEETGRTVALLRDLFNPTYERRSIRRG